MLCADSSLSPCSGLLCGLGKETASPGTASCLGLTDTALSSGDLKPNGKGEGVLETFCVGFREPKLGRDGLDIGVSVRNRDNLATGSTLSPLVPRCHGVTSCLFSRGSQSLGFLFSFRRPHLTVCTLFYSLFSK